VSLTDGELDVLPKLIRDRDTYRGRWEQATRERDEARVQRDALRSRVAQLEAERRTHVIQVD